MPSGDLEPGRCEPAWTQVENRPRRSKISCAIRATFEVRPQRCSVSREAMCQLTHIWVKGRALLVASAVLLVGIIACLLRCWGACGQTGRVPTERGFWPMNWILALNALSSIACLHARLPTFRRSPCENRRTDRGEDGSAPLIRRRTRTVCPQQSWVRCAVVGVNVDEEEGSIRRP